LRQYLASFAQQSYSIMLEVSFIHIIIDTLLHQVSPSYSGNFDPLTYTISMQGQDSESCANTSIYLILQHLLSDRHYVQAIERDNNVVHPFLAKIQKSLLKYLRGCFRTWGEKVPMAAVRISN